MAIATPPSVLPDISPSRGEIGWSAAASFFSAVFSGSEVRIWHEARRLRISPLEGEMPGRAEGGYRRQSLAAAEHHPDANCHAIGYISPVET
jgi:hypothetical protein